MLLGLAVLCGPALAEQWQRELQTKFGIHAELVLPSTIRKLEKNFLLGATLFDRYPNIVVSTDFIKRPGLREQFWHGCPDLLIIDEAHTCVSDGTGGRSRMLRHELGRSAVLDLPDEETVESADATPGADNDTETGDTAHRRRLRRFAARAARLEGASDNKLQLVEQTAKELLLDGFNPVIFCRFIDTAEYVAEHLSRRLGASYAVAAVTGTLPPDERQQRIKDLTADEKKRPVLVATDCLGAA